MKDLLIQLRDALAVAASPVDNSSHGHQQICAALRAVESTLVEIEADERWEDGDQYRDDEPDNERNLGLFNPITAPRRVGL